ncbi:MAG: hypothetical protein KDE10_07205, partial [Rhodobacteraceae bacterium]|nr:hypothetical protein [Paracoccaceae bacterium]
RRLAVVNVPDRADVHMRFVAFKLCLCHDGLLVSVVVRVNTHPTGFVGWAIRPPRHAYFF